MFLIMDIDQKIGIRMSEAGFKFLSEGIGKRDNGKSSYTKLLFFRELETLEFVYVTVVEAKFAEDWFEVRLSRLKKIIGSLGTEDDDTMARMFSYEHKHPMDILEEVIEFADLIASYDGSE